MKYIFIFFCLLSFSSCEKTIGDYTYYHKVTIGTPRAIVTYRVKSTGRNKTDTLKNPSYQLYNNTWEYRWYSSSPEDKYYVTVMNDTTVGFVKLLVGRNRDTLHIDSSTKSLLFKRN